MSCVSKPRPNICFQKNPVHLSVKFGKNPTKNTSRTLMLHCWWNVGTQYVASFVTERKTYGFVQDRTLKILVHKFHDSSIFYIINLKTKSFYIKERYWEKIGYKLNKANRLNNKHFHLKTIKMFVYTVNWHLETYWLKLKK